MKPHVLSTPQSEGVRSALRGRSFQRGLLCLLLLLACSTSARAQGEEFEGPAPPIAKVTALICLAAVSLWLLIVCYRAVHSGHRTYAPWRRPAALPDWLGRLLDWSARRQSARRSLRQERSPNRGRKRRNA